MFQMTNRSGNFQVDMVMAGLVLLGVFIWSIRKSQRKTKNIYGFNLEGWNLLKDDSLIYEIETLFRHGFVGEYLGMSQSFISDWHSNLISNDQQQITGFIQLRQSSAVLVPNTGSGATNANLFNVGVVRGNGCAKRFYIFKKAFKAPKTQILSSVEMLGFNEVELQQVKPLMEELEQTFGFKKWSVLNYDLHLVVLVDEIFDQSSLTRFIELSRKMTQLLK